MATGTLEQSNARDRFLADFETYVKDEDKNPPGWLAELRTRAIDQFAEVGFPTTRDERWRFSNFSKLSETSFEISDGRTAPSAASIEKHNSIGWIGANRLVFVNGSFSPKLSMLDRLPAGVFAGNLLTAVTERKQEVERHLSRIAETSGSPFTSLNTAFLADGGTLIVPDGIYVEEPIQFLYLTTDEKANQVTHPRSLIVLGESAEATVVECYIGSHDSSKWTNAVAEVVIGDDAFLDSCRIQLEGRETFHTASTQCVQGRDSNYSLATFEFGGLLSRHDINVDLAGSGATCLLNGLLQLNGRQHVDNYTTIDHAQPHCTSRESFNGIYDDRSHGVFTGRIMVRPGAMQTDAVQNSRSLLLSETARADTQPQLEILADDVKCAHGATVGPISDDALFYLRSKGLNEAAARTMLTYGFAVEMIDAIGIEELRQRLDVLLRNRLEGGM